MFQFADLREQLATYLSQEQVEEISNAYLLASKAHEGQKRSSGDPYISHPLEVARILANMHMDHQSIIAAVLHDVIEDTEVDKSDLAHRFGEKVAELVDGVSKLAQIKFETRAEAQAENLRKMVLAMANDIRVIIIKLADRLHNMRTLDHLPVEKQRRISLETLEIYAPIANRLGMNKFKTEFEDLGFAYLYPVRYRVLKEAVKKARGNRKEIINSIEKALTNRFEQENLKAISICGREKHLYSLYRKMRNKDLSLSEIMDVYALRVVVNSVDDCYRALGMVHSLYKPVHGRFKDYIAVPKANGYQSIHTTVLGQHGIPIEIQIRNLEMDKMAENGIASHWLYKEESSGIDVELRAREWLKGMLEIQKTTGSSLEFIENLKIDLYPDEVYVFTPSGEIFSLSAGATAVDFAYAVHTDIGNLCIACKIDRRLAPLSTRLSSGQTVEIITAKGAHPNPAWLSFVVTGKARSNIRHWLKSQQDTESATLGRRLLERALASLSLSFNDFSNKKIKEVLSEMNLDSLEDLYQEIGLGNQVASLVSRRLIADNPQKREEVSSEPLIIKGTEGMVVKYAKCCRPIPGDPVIGFLSAGRGMVIHRESCNNVEELKRSPDKYVFVQWSDEAQGEFQIELQIEVINKRGVLANIASVISECDANIENVHVDERDNRHNALLFLINIKNRDHLAKVIKRLRDINIVTRVFRVK